MKIIYIFVIALITNLNLVFAKSLPGPEILNKVSLEEDLEEFKSSLFKSGTVKAVNDGKTLDFVSFFTIVKENHPDIISAGIKKEIASAKRLEAQGAFDPSINSQDFFYRYNSSSAPGQVQEAFMSNTSLDFLTGYGAKFGIGAKFAQGDIKTPLSPTGDGGEYFVRAQIPLLRGAIYNSKFVKEKSSRLDETISDYLLFMTRLQTLNSGAKAYWDWVVHKKIMDVETNLLNIVSEQVDFVQAQVDFGNMPAISAVEAQREIQKRQGKVNTALRKFQASTIKLSKFIWTQDGRPFALPAENQVPVALEDPALLVKDDINEAKLNALINRPEFKALDLSREISKLERGLAKNQMLPQLDTYVNAGLETGEDSISGPSLEAGLNISLPLRRREARGQKEQAELRIKQLNLEERKLIQNVFLEIEDTASYVETSYMRYLAAKSDYELSAKLEEGEKLRFELGDSTLFLVIQRQRATVEANIELLKTIADYNIGKVRFKLLQGNLL